MANRTRATCAAPGVSFRGSAAPVPDRRAQAGRRGRRRAVLATLAGATLLLAPAIGAIGAVAPEVPARVAVPVIPAEVTARLAALDPERLTARDVADVLAHVPAPQVVLLQGSVAVVTMAPLAEFLIAMGYPADRLRQPGDGSFSESSFGDSRRLAGTLAWYYEHHGVRPLLVGHSQGGMLAIRTLYEFAGAFDDAIPMWNPVARTAEARTMFVDPLSGQARPVVGLTLPYAAALATGKLPRLLLGQWTMLSKLRRIPDTVVEFTGFTLEWDPIAGQFPGAEPYAATGTAVVRNVTLPAAASHVTLPAVDEYAHHPATRAWIEDYAPGAGAPVPQVSGVDTANLLHAADLWHSIRKHWCLEARRLAQAQQAHPELAARR
jgi:hypothetical protein